MRIANRQIDCELNIRKYSYMETSDKCTTNYFSLPSLGISGNLDWMIYLKCSTTDWTNTAAGFVIDEANSDPAPCGGIFPLKTGWNCDTGIGSGVGRITILPIATTSISDIYEITRTPTWMKVVRNDGVGMEGFGVCPRTEFSSNVRLFYNSSVAKARRIYNMQVWQSGVLVHDYVPAYCEDSAYNEYRICWRDFVNGKKYFSFNKSEDSLFSLH